VIKIFRLIFKTETTETHQLKRSLLLVRTAHFKKGDIVTFVPIDVIRDDVALTEEQPGFPPQLALEEGLNKIEKEAQIISVTCETPERCYMVICRTQ
jgi:hypothetical protein